MDYGLITKAMTKKEFLELVTQQSANQNVSIEEIYSAYEAGLPSDFPQAISFTIGNVLSFLGGGIIVLGLTILVGNNWTLLNDPLKILVTLGVAVALHSLWALGVFTKKLPTLSHVALFASGILYPVGLLISLNIANIDLSTLEKTLIISTLTGMVYGVSHLLEKHPLLSFFTIVHATTFFYALFSFRLQQIADGFSSSDLSTYLQIFPVAVGISHLFLASWTENSSIKRFIPPFLTILAVLQIYGSLFSLSFRFNWLDYVFPLVLMLGYYASVYVNNRIILLSSALFTFLIIFKITAERFSESLGWPISLIIIGFSFILIGIGTLYLERNFVDRKR